MLENISFPPREFDDKASSRALAQEAFKPTVSSVDAVDGDRAKLVLTDTRDCQLMCALGDPSKDMQNAAKEFMDRWHIKYEINDVFDRLKSPSQLDREGAAKALQGYYGISPESALTAIKLGSGLYKDREAASRSLEDAGCSNMKLLHGISKNSDAEIGSRADQVMQFLMRTRPASELVQHPEVLNYLPTESLPARLSECLTQLPNADEPNSPDASKLILAKRKADWSMLTKEAEILRAFPEFVTKRIEDLTQQQGKLTGAEQYRCGEEIKLLSDIPGLQSRMYIGIANMSSEFEDKKSNLLKAIEAAPHIVKTPGFVWECQQSKVFKDKGFMKAFIKAGGDADHGELPPANP